MHEVSGAAKDSRHRIWRWKQASSLMHLLLICLLFCHTGSLPVHLGYLLLPNDAKVVTQGCETKTCCTKLCYVDQYGKHRCVHEPDDSCKCKTSPKEVNANPVVFSTVITLSRLMAPLPKPVLAGWICLKQFFVTGWISDTPTPPPQ